MLGSSSYSLGRLCFRLGNADFLWPVGIDTLYHSHQQICSAVQNQDFTIIDDLISGMKAALYLSRVDELSDWNIQSPPTSAHQKGKPVIRITKEPLAHFGAFNRQRKHIIATMKLEQDLLNHDRQERIIYRPKEPVPTIKVSINGLINY